MAYYAYVTRLNNYRKDENSDNLWLADCFGEGVIVGPNMREGQIVLYMPQDGEIQRWFGDELHLFRKNLDGSPQGGYIEDNGHIKSIKLRGNKSSGVVIDYIKIIKLFGDQCWAEGDKVTEINGKEFVTKFIPTQKTQRITPKTSYKGKKAEGIIYPEFERHVETEQLAYNLNQFQPGDKINMTLKLHGTSQRSMRTYAEMPKNWFRKLFHMKPKKIPAYVLGTRRTVVSSSSEGFYGNDDFRCPHHEKIAQYVGDGMEVFYEVVGYYGPNEADTIMPIADNTKINDKAFVKQYGKRTVFSYGCNPGESEMYVYRITSNNGEHEYTPEEMIAWCKEAGVKWVPQIDNFIFTTIEDLQNRINKYFEDLTDPIGKTHIKEGVVIRIVNRRTFTAFKSKTWEFKVLSGIAAENANTISADIAEEV